MMSNHGANPIFYNKSNKDSMSRILVTPTTPSLVGSIKWQIKTRKTKNNMEKELQK